MRTFLFCSPRLPFRVPDGCVPELNSKVLLDSVAKNHAVLRHARFEDQRFLAVRDRTPAKPVVAAGGGLRTV
jgi:hypothetical protein